MKIKKAFSVVVAGLFCAIATLVSPYGAHASGSITISSSTTTDGNTTVAIRREVHNLSTGSIVNNTFTYTITPSANNPHGASNEPTSATVVFNDVYSNTPVDPDLPSTAYYALATGTVDFTGATYTAPGDYEYTITETASSNSQYSVDSVSSYHLYVSVRNIMLPDYPDVTEGDLEATVMAFAANVATGEKEETATFGTGNSILTGFSISNGVSGNAGDINHCFKHKVEIMPGAGLSSGDTINIWYDDAGKDLCQDTATTITVGTPAYVYVQMYQFAHIGDTSTTSGYDVIPGAYQLPIGTQYKVTAIGDEDYSASATCDLGGYGDMVEFGDNEERTCGLITITNAAPDQGTSFRFTKNLSALTGLSLKSLPYIIAGLISAVGIFFIVRNIVNIRLRRR